MISVIIQSRGSDMVNMKRSISCFLHQTYKEKELILVIDQLFTQETYTNRLNELLDGKTHQLQSHNIHIISNLTTEFIHNNVSAMRNVGIKEAKGAFILLMDDDEDIPAEYLAHTLSYWEKITSELKKDIVLTPTLMYRHTGKIQNQGFSHFNYRLSRPIGCVLGQRPWAEIQMYSGNSLFAPAYIFKQHPMDERFDFVYEDLTYSYTLSKAGYPIIVTKDIEIYHMERDKTKLEDAWVGSEFQAYKKSKHKILFIRKFATFRQKLQFFLVGFRGQPLRLIAKVLIYNPKNKRSIIKNIRKGTRDGLK